jgi:hypothetical protein
MHEAHEELDFSSCASCSPKAFVVSVTLCSVIDHEPQAQLLMAMAIPSHAGASESLLTEAFKPDAP